MKVTSILEKPSPILIELHLFRNLSRPGSVRYYSHAELKTIQKFNNLFNKVVVLPSNTFCGNNLNSFTNQDSGDPSEEEELLRISDEKISLSEYSSNSNLDVGKTNYYPSKYQRSQENKCTNELKLVEGEYSSSFKENYQDQPVIFQKLKIDNQLEEYSFFSQIIGESERSVLQSEWFDFKKIKNNPIERKKCIGTNKTQQNSLWDLKNSVSQYNETMSYKSPYVLYPLSMPNQEGSIQICNDRNCDLKGAIQEYSPYGISQSLRAENLRMLNEYKNFKNLKKYKFFVCPSTTSDVEVTPSLRLRSILNMNTFGYFDFQNKLHRREGQYQFLVENISIIEAGLTENNKNFRLSHSDAIPVVSTQKCSIETPATSPLMFRRNEEISSKPKEDLSMILDEMRVLITRHLFRRKHIKRTLCNCKEIEHASRKWEHTIGNIRELTEKSGNEYAGTDNITSEVKNEEKRRERQKKIEELLRTIVTDKRCIRNVNKNSDIRRATVLNNSSEKLTVHCDILDKLKREKEIIQLSKMISMKRYKQANEKQTDNYNMISDSCRKTNEQYDRKKQRDMRLKHLIDEMKQKQKCFCRPCGRITIDESLSEYATADLKICEVEPQQKSNSNISEGQQSQEIEHNISSHDVLYITEKILENELEEDTPNEEMLKMEKISNELLETKTREAETQTENEEKLGIPLILRQSQETEEDISSHDVLYIVEKILEKKLEEDTPKKDMLKIETISNELMEAKTREVQTQTENEDELDIPLNPSSDVRLREDSEISQEPTEREVDKNLDGIKYGEHSHEEIIKDQSSQKLEEYPSDRSLETNMNSNEDEPLFKQSNAEERHSSANIEELATGVDQITDKRKKSDTSRTPVDELIKKNDDLMEFEIQTKKNENEIMRKTEQQVVSESIIEHELQKDNESLESEEKRKSPLKLKASEEFRRSIMEKADNEFPEISAVILNNENDDRYRKAEADNQENDDENISKKQEIVEKLGTEKISDEFISRTDSKEEFSEEKILEKPQEETSTTEMIEDIILNQNIEGKKKNNSSEIEKTPKTSEDFTYSDRGANNKKGMKSADKPVSVVSSPNAEKQDIRLEASREKDVTLVRSDILGEIAEKNERPKKKPGTYKLIRKFNQENEIEMKRIAAVKDDETKITAPSYTAKKVLLGQEVEEIPSGADGRPTHSNKRNQLHRKNLNNDENQPEIRNDSKSKRARKYREYPKVANKIGLPTNEVDKKSKTMKKTTDTKKDWNKTRKKYSNLPHGSSTSEGKVLEGDSNKKRDIRTVSKRREYGKTEGLRKPHDKSRMEGRTIEQLAVNQLNLNDGKNHGKPTEIKNSERRTIVREPKKPIRKAEVNNHPTDYTKIKTKRTKEKETKQGTDYSDTSGKSSRVTSKRSEQKLKQKRKKQKRNGVKETEKKVRAAYSETTTDQESLHIPNELKKNNLPEDKGQIVSVPPTKSHEEDVDRKDNDMIKIELKSEYLEILEDVALSKALEMEEILKISISPKNKTGVSIKDQSKGEYIHRDEISQNGQQKRCKCNKKLDEPKKVESEIEWSPSSLININIVVDDAKKRKCICQRKVAPSQSNQKLHSLSNVFSEKTTNIGSKVKANFVSACKKNCNMKNCNCFRMSDVYYKPNIEARYHKFPQTFPSRKENCNLPNVWNMPVHDSPENISFDKIESDLVRSNLNCYHSSNVEPCYSWCENDIPNTTFEKKINETHICEKNNPKRGRFSEKNMKLIPKVNDSTKYNEFLEFEGFDSDDSQPHDELSSNFEEKKALSKLRRNSRLYLCSSYFDEKLSDKVEIHQKRDDKYDSETKIKNTDLTGLDDELCRKLGSHDFTNNCIYKSFPNEFIPIFREISNKVSVRNISRELIRQNENIRSPDEIGSAQSKLAEKLLIGKNSPKNCMRHTQNTGSKTIFSVSLDDSNTPQIFGKEKNTFEMKSIRESTQLSYDETVYNIFHILTQSEQKFITDGNSRHILKNSGSNLEQYTSQEIFDNIDERGTSFSEAEKLFWSNEVIESNRTNTISNKKSKKFSDKEKRKKRREFLNNYEKQRSFIMRKRCKVNGKQKRDGENNSEKNTDKKNLNYEHRDGVSNDNTTYCINNKTLSVYTCSSSSSRSKYTPHYNKMSLDDRTASLMRGIEPLASNNDQTVYSPYRTDPALYHVAVEGVENENQVNTPKVKIKFRIAFFFKKSKGKLMNWFKFLQKNKTTENPDINDTKKYEDTDRRLAAAANLMKQKKMLSSKLRQSDMKTSKLYLYKKLYEEKNRVQITGSIDEDQPEPVLQEIKSCDIIEPILDNISGEEDSQEDEREEQKKHDPFVLSEDSSILFIKKELYDRLQRYGKLRYTLYIGERNELDHISIESIESYEGKIECDDKPFFATFDLGTKDVLVHVTKDTTEEEKQEEIFKDENYVACQNSQVKLSLMRGAQYLQQLDPRKANIIEIDCSNKLHEIKICYKKVERSKTCICQNPQMCKSIQLESSDLSSIIIDRMDEFLDAHELCRNCEECMEKSKACLDNQECTDDECYLKRDDVSVIEEGVSFQLVSQLQSTKPSKNGHKNTVENSETSIECRDEICSEKIDDSLSNESEVNIKTVQFMQIISQKSGFQEATFIEKDRKERTPEYCRNDKRKMCAINKYDSGGTGKKWDDLHSAHLPQVSGLCQKAQRRKTEASKNILEKFRINSEKRKYPITKHRGFRRDRLSHCEEDFKPTLILTITHFESILDI